MGIDQLSRARGGWDRELTQGDGTSGWNCPLELTALGAAALGLPAALAGCTEPFFSPSHLKKWLADFFRYVNRKNEP
jgi:hypothetical protein